jgi:hypothetical protein
MVRAIQTLSPELPIARDFSAVAAVSSTFGFNGFNLAHACITARSASLRCNLVLNRPNGVSGFRLKSTRKTNETARFNGGRDHTRLLTTLCCRRILRTLLRRRDSERPLLNIMPMSAPGLPETASGPYPLASEKNHSAYIDSLASHRWSF